MSFKEHYDVPCIHCLNAINITSTMLFNANGKRVHFYALEQPVLLNGLRVPGLHVSLAYKVGCPFTLSEMNKVSPWLGPFAGAFGPVDDNMVLPCKVSPILAQGVNLT